MAAARATAEALAELIDLKVALAREKAQERLLMQRLQDCKERVATATEEVKLALVVIQEELEAAVAERLEEQV